MKILGCFLLCLSALAQAPPTISVVSAASGDAGVSPDSIVTIFGSNLTDRTEQASGLPLPTTLAGIGVQVMNTAAGLLYASPGQINFVLPAGIPAGSAAVNVVQGGKTVAQGNAQVQPVAPALFFVGSNHVAAGNADRRIAVVGPLVAAPLFSCDSADACAPVPLNPGIDTPTTIELYGTGIRSGTTVTATIGGQTVPVDFAGAQPQFPGLDQVNLPLLLSLRGAGKVNVVVTVDGKPSNPVQIQIQ
jgi:uncharacterized protein (TIGR03437 family)